MAYALGALEMSDSEIEGAGSWPQAQRVRGDCGDPQLEQLADAHRSGLEGPDVMICQKQEIGSEASDVLEHRCGVLLALGEELRVCSARAGVVQIPAAHHVPDSPSVRQQVAPGHHRVVQLADREVRRAQEQGGARGHQATPPVCSSRWPRASAPADSVAPSWRARLQRERLVAVALRSE